jgi:mevalonate kinase
MIDRSFPAKLLLFGEHVLLLGAPALAVPLPRFSARWHWAEQVSPRLSLSRFAHSAAVADVLGDDAAQRFIQEAEEGHHLDSNIPRGYGLGSSGALCAAVYARYAPSLATTAAGLKSDLARMESHFHGASSGIDPLTSYLDRPLLIRDKSTVEVVSPRPWSAGPHTFLLDTGQPRHSETSIQWFAEQARENAQFVAMLESQYLPTQANLVTSWIEADEQLFWPNIDVLSQLQYEYCKPLIPKHLLSFWETSLESQNFRLKICGAGGGGFILGFARDAEIIGTISAQHPVVLPFAPSDGGPLA